MEMYLFIAAHSLEERLEEHKSVIIFRFAQLLHQVLGLLLVELLPEVGEETVQFITNHGVVVVLVVQLQDLHEVVESTLVLGVLGSLVDGVHFTLFQTLLSFLSFSSYFRDGFEGGVEVAGSEEVSGVEGVHSAVALEVVHIEGKVNSLHLLLLKS